MFTDEQVEAAVRALSDPERFAGAERLVAAAAPQLQRILGAGARTRAAGSARRTSRRSAPRVAEPDEAERATRIETLLAEETRMGMLVGVAVGWELARELGTTTNEPEGD